MALPPPVPNQAFCTVSALEGGSITAAEELFITDAIPGHRMTMPVLCFLVQRSQKPHKLLFDLGIRSDWDAYPPKVQEMLTGPDPMFSIDSSEDCIKSLAKGGLTPADIDFVCISHCHWDHAGCTHAFAQSTFLVGDDCHTLFTDSYPENPDAMYPSDLLPSDRTRYLQVAEWDAIGPFPRAFDFYGDGSVYIVDSPGHLAGHVNLLVRTSADGAWIYLAADSAHHWKILTGESQIRVGIPGNPHLCMHHNKAVAEEHIGHIRELWKMPRVRVVLAHDVPWYAENKGGSAFWPGMIPSL